jgi:Tol biopolymer transport system component
VQATESVIVFDRSNTYELWKVRSDGSAEQQLTDKDATPPAWDRRPTICPAGTRIFFERRDIPGDQNMEIWKMNTDGSGQTFVSGSETPTINVEHPDCGSNGEHTYVLFRSNEPVGDDYDFEIYRMDQSGGNVTQLTENDTEDAHPAWCGTSHVVFQHEDEEDGDFDIWIMGVDGSNPEELVNDADEDGQDDLTPACSPDGLWVVYSRGPDVFIRTTGTEPEDEESEVNLTANIEEWSGHLEIEPSWSPGGTSIVLVVGCPSGPFCTPSPEELWKVPIDVETQEPGEPEQLTDNSYQDVEPNWGEIVP